MARVIYMGHVYIVVPQFSVRRISNFAKKLGSERQFLYKKIKTWVSF